LEAVVRKHWLIFGLLGLLLAGFSLGAGAQVHPSKTAPQTHAVKVTALMGKATLDQIKKAYPGGRQDPVSPRYNTLLSKVNARTRYVEPKGKTAYYFNRRGILVRVATTPKRMITKNELLRDIPQLKFTREGPNGLPVAFVKRPDGIIQGFYLTKNGQEVKLTTLDYVKK
jgi:hypothetical protein